MLEISGRQAIQKASHIRWRILAILILASFFNYWLRMNINFAAPEMKQELGLSLTQWGYIAAAFTAGYALFQFPGGLLGDRFGPRRVLTVIVVLWGLCSALTSLVPSQEDVSVFWIVVSLGLVRFLVGATHAPLFPVMNASIVRWFPPGGWALPLGLSSTGLTLGSAAAAIVVPVSVVALGWRWTFILMAPAALFIAWAWWRYSRDDPADHPAVNEAELELIRDGREALDDPSSKDERGDGSPDWLVVLKNRDALMLMFSYSFMNYVYYMIFTFGLIYLVDYHEMGSIQAGVVSAAQWVAGAAGAALGGLLCDALCRKLGLRWGCRWPIIIGMGVSVLLLQLTAFHGDLTMVIGAFIALFFFNQLNEGAYWATSVAVGGRLAGSAGGLMNTGANAMGMLNALLVPVIVSTLGWQAAMSSVAVAAIAGILCMLLVRADKTVLT